MPRKQRFKPSRKPKPTVTEETSKPMADPQQSRSMSNEEQERIGSSERRDERALDRVNGSDEERPVE
jgi:hypothetical protein